MNWENKQWINWVYLERHIWLENKNQFLWPLTMWTIFFILYLYKELISRPSCWRSWLDVTQIDVIFLNGKIRLLQNKLQKCWTIREVQYFCPFLISTKAQRRYKASWITLGLLYRDGIGIQNNPSIFCDIYFPPLDCPVQSLSWQIQWCQLLC